MTVFSSFEQLKTHLDNQRGCPGLSWNTCGGLFILEDLGLNKVVILGSELGIPASFFGAHWTDPGLKTDIFDHREYYQLKYLQPHRLVLSTECEDYQLAAYRNLMSSLARYLELFDKVRKFETSMHQVSNWTTTLEGPWTGEP